MKKILTAAALMAALLSMTACGCSASTDMEPGGDTSMSSSGSSALSGNTYEGGDTLVGLGLAADTSGSADASDSANGSASFDLTACALCVDEQGRIIDVRFDSIETSVGFDPTGMLTGDMGAELRTKREMGDEYGLGAVSEIGKNWYEQADALEEWMRGKTVTEVMGMKLTTSDGEQYPDEEDLRTSVTISVGGYLKALEKAYADATGTGSSGGYTDRTDSTTTGDAESTGGDVNNGTANGTTDGTTDGDGTLSQEPLPEDDSSMAQ